MKIPRAAALGGPAPERKAPLCIRWTPLHASAATAFLLAYSPPCCSQVALEDEKNTAAGATRAAAPPPDRCPNRCGSSLNHSKRRTCQACNTALLSLAAVKGGGIGRVARDGDEENDFQAAEEPIQLVKRAMNGCASDQAADRAILQVAFGGEADRQSLRGASPRGRRVVGPL